MASQSQTITLKCKWGGGILNLKSPNTGKLYLYDPIKNDGLLKDIDQKDITWLLSLTYGAGQDAITREHYFYL